MLITPRQFEFLKSLMADRPAWAARMGLTDEILYAMSKAEASTWIDLGLKQPKETAPADASPLPNVPAGHYAVPSATGNNDFDFYRVDRPTEGQWAGRVYVKRIVGGRPDQRLRYAEIRGAIQRIADFGPVKAATTYGQQLGQCCVCNRHLTDEESRRLGIGPDCRGQRAA